MSDGWYAVSYRNRKVKGGAYWMDESGVMTNPSGDVMDGIEVLPVLNPVIRRDCDPHMFRVWVNNIPVTDPLVWEEALVVRAEIAGVI